MKAQRNHVQLSLQVIDLTDPGVVQPPRVRQRAANEAAQNAVEIVGVSGGGARQQVARVNQAGGGGAQPQRAPRMGMAAGLVGEMMMPGVAFQRHVASAAAAKSPAKSPRDDDTDAKLSLIHI